MTSTDTILKILADSIASLVILSLVAFLSASILGISGASLSAVGATWFGLYTFVVLMSATKLYGKKIYNVIKRIGETFVK